MIVKDKKYYDQFNNCDNIRDNFDYLTIPQAALIWCGVPRSEINIELKQCKPKGDTNGKLRNTFIHPYIECVEHRCVILLEAFDTGKLKMGRDGGNSDYIWGERDKTEPTHQIGTSQGIGHINPDRRTIKINDLKEYIQEYHPEDMPKSLFSDIAISKASPITHVDYLTLKAKNEAIEEKLQTARTIYKQQKARIEELENQIAEAKKTNINNSADDLKIVPHQSYRTVDRIMYAMAKLSHKDNSSPYSQNIGSLNEAITTILQNEGITLEYQSVGKWLQRASEINPIKK